MWVWIIVAVVVVAAAVFAFWPRRAGISDAKAYHDRQGSIGESERHDNSNRRNFPMGGSL